MDEYIINPTSKDSAKIQDITLRETKTTRLVFRGLFVNNINDKDAALKGKFLYQRKSRTNEWEDTKNINMSTLKAGEGVKLSLKAGEVFSLYNELTNLYQIYNDDGIPFKNTKYVKLEENLKEIIEMNEEELSEFLNVHKQVGLDAFNNILSWAIKVGDPNKVIEKLDVLDVDVLGELNSLLGLSKLKSVLEIWNKNKNNSDEEFWQSVFEEYSIILSQLFSFPVIIHEDKAYVGGKGLTNTGGNIVDFIMTNQITSNLAFIEIKTPTTKLIGPEYRKNIPNISKELTGAVTQVLSYSDSLGKEFNNLRINSDYEFEAFNPECVVIAGTTEKEIDDKYSKRSFELYRNNMKDVSILTYDEVFKRVKVLIDLFEKH